MEADRITAFSYCVFNLNNWSPIHYVNRIDRILGFFLKGLSLCLILYNLLPGDWRTDIFQGEAPESRAPEAISGL